MIDYANAPIFGIDNDGRVNEWNRKAVEITGYNRDEVLGRNLVEAFITPEFQASVKEVLDNALQGKGTDNFEFPLYSRHGQKVEVLLNATTRVDASNTPIVRSTVAPHICMGWPYLSRFAIVYTGRHWCRPRHHRTQKC